MEKFLLLEDDLLTRASLNLLLQKRFPSAEVDSTGTAKEAEQLLQRYARDRSLLDVAIVDILVPTNRGESPEVTSLSQLVRRLHPEALVVHMTAFMSIVDDLIGPYIYEYSRQNLVAPVDKHSERWADELCSRIATWLIQRQMTVESGNTAGQGLPHLQSVRSKSATFGRAALVRDIGRYWNLLEPEFQERIRCHFDIQEAEGQIIVR